MDVCVHSLTERFNLKATAGFVTFFSSCVITKSLSPHWLFYQKDGIYKNCSHGYIFKSHQNISGITLGHMVSENYAQIFHANAGHFRRVLFAWNENSLKHLGAKESLRLEDKFSASGDMRIVFCSQRGRDGI